MGSITYNITYAAMVYVEIKIRGATVSTVRNFSQLARTVPASLSPLALKETSFSEAILAPPVKAGVSQIRPDINAWEP